MLRKLATTSNAIIHRSLSAQVYVPRTRHLDINELITENLNIELASVGVRLSEVALHSDGVYEKHKSSDARYFMPVLTHVSLQNEILLNERIISIASIVDVQADKGQLVVNHHFRKPEGEITSSGYSVLQKFISYQPSGFSCDEEAAFRKKLNTKASHFSYQKPILIAPKHPLGKKVLLAPEETYVKKHQTEHNGVISINHLAEIAHMYALEKSLLENTSYKTHKPKLLSADTFIYGTLHVSDTYHVYLYTEKNNDPDKCTWVATITNTSDQIIAIVKNTHLLTEKDKVLTAKLNDYFLAAGYHNLFANQSVNIASLPSLHLRHTSVE